MSRCSCWHRESYRSYDQWHDCLREYERDVCWGTKEREECSCGGDESKCDFYPEKRDEKHKATKFTELMNSDWKPVMSKQEAEAILNCIIVD